METRTCWQDKLLRDIEDAGLLRRPRRVQLPNEHQAIEGFIDVDGRVVSLEIDVGPLYQHKLPIIKLRPWDALGFLPHIDPSGTICYLEQEGIVLDRRQPVEVVRACLDEVRRTLNNGITGKNRGDFADEFDVYWGRIDECITAASGIDFSDEVSEVVIAVSTNARTPFRIARNYAGIPRIVSMYRDYGPWHASHALYVPLEPNTLLVPPRSDRPFWNAGNVRALLQHCSEANRERLLQLVKRGYSATEYVIVRLPRPSGGASLFGIRFEGVSERHPLAEGGQATKLTPIVIFRRDRDYFVQRGGGHMELESKRVLLVGCGAVGSRVAFELARAGIGRIGLIDPDTLKPENAYRHVLGKRYWGQNKARALKQELAQLPFANVVAVPGAIDTALDSRQVNLADYHLVVCAIGDPTVELALNERVRVSLHGPSMIHTWLEPLGIGGHAVLSGNGDLGCFECLYTEPNGNEATLNNRASFAAPDQKFSRALAGCDTLHTPYGSLDAEQTAHLATRLALDMLMGRVEGNRLRSWKGDATAFLAKGFKLAPRYADSLDELARQETLFASPYCPVCGETERSDRP